MCQAKAACYYIVKYITKDGLQLSNVLALCKAAYDRITKFPSKAEDTGTAQRTSQHLLSRLMNSLNGKIEVSSTLATLALLGLPSNYYSHEYFWCRVTSAMAYVKRCHSSNPPKGVFTTNISFVNIHESVNV
jgi:hypothetical protein